MFQITSRYYNLPVAKLESAAGDTIAYVRRRFIPPASRFTLLLEHTVSESERLDHIAAQYLGDPEQFWRIADANNAMQPDDLVQTVGRRIRITLPEGIPGTPNG
jgi:hypothetical protein